MEDKKLRTILQDMEGITYLEWQKVKQMVDAIELPSFSLEFIRPCRGLYIV